MTAMPSALPVVADNYYRTQAQTTRRAADQNQRVWKQMPDTNLRDRWRWFEDLALPALVSTTVTAQAESIKLASAYLALSTAVQGLDPLEVVLLEAGFLSPQALFEDSLRQPMIKFTHLVAGGMTDSSAKTSGLTSLVRWTEGLVSSSASDAVATGIGVHTGIAGYYRRLSLPSCKRCVILAGKWFAKNADFQRHPQCDCTSIPAAEKYDDATLDVKKAVESGKVTGLTEYEREQIESGRDIISTINWSPSNTGRYPAGNWSWIPAETKRRYGVPEKRLTPSEVLKVAKTDEQRRRLMEIHGYVKPSDYEFLGN